MKTAEELKKQAIRMSADPWCSGINQVRYSFDEEELQEYAEEFYKDKMAELQFEAFCNPDIYEAPANEHFEQEAARENLKYHLMKFHDFYMSCSTEIAQLPHDKFIEEYLKQRP